MLKAQKENIITAETIIKIENLGTKINTALPELRPTISADGNLLFLFVKTIRGIQNMAKYPTHRIFGLVKKTVPVAGVKRCI